MKINHRYAPSLILSIILVFSMIVFGVCSAMNFMILNENKYKDVVEKENIPQIVSGEIEKYFDNSMDYSGIPADVYMSALSESDIKEMIENKIGNVFLKYIKNDDDNVDFDELIFSGHDYTKMEENITSFFDKFAEENNVKKDDAFEKQLKNTIDTAKNEIESYCDVYMMQLVHKTGVMDMVRNHYYDLTPATYFFGGLALVLMLMLLAFYVRRIGLGCYWIGISTICAGVLTMIPTLIVKLTGYTDRLAVGNKSVYTAMTSVMSYMLNRLILLECCVVGFGLLMLVFYVIGTVKNREKYKNGDIEQGGRIITELAEEDDEPVGETAEKAPKADNSSDEDSGKNASPESD